MTKTQDLELVLNSIRSKRSIAFVKGLFRTLNQLYRECIDRVQERAAGDNDASDDEEVKPHVPTISLADLRSSLSNGESVITEIDMVENVFETIEREIHSTSSEESPGKNHQYLLAVTMAYASSLLSFLIFPHRRLQTFLLELTVDSRSYTSLRQLLNFHVIMDSPEVLEKLGSIPAREPWVSLARLDMAKRMNRTDIVVECLFEQDRSREVIEYVRRYDPKFEIEKVFNLLGKNVTQTRKAVWEQVETWNVTPGLLEDDRPVLSHRVVMLNSS